MLCAMSMLLALMVETPAAMANPADMFGLGAPSQGRGKSGLVLDSDSFALWRNPSMLGFVERDVANVGGFFGFSRFGCFGDVVSTGPLVCSRNVLYDGKLLIREVDPEGYYTDREYDGLEQQRLRREGGQLQRDRPARPGSISFTGRLPNRQPRRRQP